MAIVEFENVSRVYRSGEHELRALDGVSFALEAGKFVVILGPSGAGKSTLLNLLGGLDSPTSGTIRVSGRDISTLTGKELADYRAAVGFVFQFYNLIPTLTVYEHTVYKEAMGEATEGKTMGSVLPVLFLAIAILTMVTTMHRIAVNEKLQIGTLKALASTMGASCGTTRPTASASASWGRPWGWSWATGSAPW